MIKEMEGRRKTDRETYIQTDKQRDREGAS